MPLLLLVEDNQDVLYYLQSFLKENYQLLIADNGQIGIDLAIEHIPDIIVSDVMMPQKDGFELCETLKQDQRSSHIPIILLTAKATLEDRISGLSFGADAYLAKPFSKEELLIRLQKLIEGRQLLQQYYTQNKQTSKTNKPNPQQEKEQAFLTQLHEIINSNLNNSAFDIPQLCLAIAMSKTQLYRKVKALAGKTVALYIRSIRLNKARQLLIENNVSISEVAEQVGFSDVSYFSRVFKQEFGFSPSENR